MCTLHFYNRFRPIFPKKEQARKHISLNTMNFQKIYTNVSRQIAKANGSPIEYDLAPYQEILSQINALEATFTAKSDQALQTFAQKLKQQVQQNPTLEVILPEAFALCREICQRVLGMRPYDVQVLAGIALHQGKLTEMKTGEGKTLAAVLPTYLNALLGKGVHVLTFNDYLAQRDATWMQPVYEFLGLTVGYIQQNMMAEKKKQAYQCDITYATAKEVGFDYLRSFIAYTPEELLLRPFHYAIVDEADALLIDEARNPLVLAGNIRQTTLDLYHIAQFTETLQLSTDYATDEYKRNVFLLEAGIQKIESHFKLTNLYEDTHQELLIAINLALQAKTLLHKDIDYVVKEGQIKLIDEFTGRIVEDRKWQNGLQSAVEAKEGVKIQIEGQILNTITLPHFIQQYPKIAGMTATAQLAADEFADFYGLATVVIPPNISSQRIDHPDLIFTHKAAKMAALIKEVKTVHQTGRPILIGTLTVKESEEIQEALQQHQVSCTVLNAKQDAQEAAIVANAGKLNAITIATNMAGRGTDIMLGGKNGEHQEKIKTLGGLYVIGTNRHESRRIDDQLKGRAGRQGDPGSSRFIICFEDHLMQKYKLTTLLPKKYRNIQQNEALHQNRIMRDIAQAQRIIEGQMHAMRKTLYQYSAFMEQQRKVFHQDRQSLLNQTYDQPLIKEYLLNQYDQQWSAHLNEVAQIKEGIYWVRVAGKTPFYAFCQQADAHFLKIRQTMEALTQEVAQSPPDTASILIKKPSSTWTYVVNDNPLGNELGLALTGNIGLQLDPFGLLGVLVMDIARRFKKKKK